MATVTIRLSAAEKADLVKDAHGQGLTASELVRRSLGLRADAADLMGRVDDLERRLSRLERVAGVES